MRIISLALASLIVTHAFASDQGWFSAGSQPASYEFGVDTSNPHQGVACAFIKARAAEVAGFGTWMQIFSAEHYLNARIRLSGYMRTEQAVRAQMWLRVDGEGKQVLRFDNMNARPVSGTTEWQRYDVVLDVPNDARGIAFGFFLAGGGTVWADDFSIERIEQVMPATNEPSFGYEPVNLEFESGGG